jgi:hypothetical protein
MNIPSILQHTQGRNAINHALLTLLFLLPLVGWGQSLPFVVTTPDDVTNHNEKFYWIESVGATGFYAVPHSDDAKASTTNAPTLRALWYFMESGESGYYYIINKETGTYLKKTGAVGGDGTIGVAIYANADDSKFKFSFDTPQGITQGSWVIYPKEAGTTGWLSKKSGNAQYNLWLKVSNYNNTPVGDLNSQWKIVARADMQWPKSGLPFVVSTSSDKHYYRINHAQSTEYNISYDGSNFVTISSVNDNKTAWYFEEAAADPDIDNLKYYYIVNASSEKYLKFTATTINGSNQNDKFALSDYDSENEDRFQFVVVNSYGGNAGYSIMPKLAMSKYDVSNYANSMVPGSVANNEKLDLRSDRNNSNAHWNFVPTEYPLSCAITSITYSSETGQITITSTPDDAEIHYTTDGVTEPSSTVGTPYSGPFAVSSTVTIKAIATKDGYNDSPVVTVSFDQVATPTIQNNGSNAISITSATEGATIYYTTDGNTPTTASTLYTGPLTENVSGVTIKAIAVKEGWINSNVETGAVTLKCAKPVIIKTGDYVTISCAFPATGVTIYYTIGGEDPTTSSSVYSSPIQVELGDVIKAIATASGYDNSDVATKTIHEDLTPDGEGKYHITNQNDFETFVDMASSADGASYHYILEDDVTAISEITEPFTGIFDGNYHTITGLSDPLFNTVNGGTVKNLVLEDVSISSHSGNTGAIACTANGAARIYNVGVLSGLVGGGDNVGGLVGLLDGEARVVNCYSYADITGGTNVGGIVGYNNVATASNNLKTMVFGCMFYGDITGGTNKSPIYGGNIITNRGDQNGVGNYNYFRLEAPFVQPTGIAYNCALGAEDRFLQRFEFYRHLLNSHRELAGWWVTGNYDKTPMYKWVLPPDSIGTSHPYPILMPFDKYPSVVNIDAANATTGKPRNQGGKLGTLTVNIQMGDGAVYNHPGTGDDEAQITTPQLTLNITDKDTAHFNFNYYKVQLPYYNDVGTKNYNGNRVVTGWKIVGITGGTPGNYSTGEDVTYTDGVLTATPYNFADRNCTNKDLYSESGRVFNQGAYWDVPYGVTAITIEPYWAKCTYLADAYADVTYNQAMSTASNVPNVGGGQIYTNGNSYSIAGESQKVFTTKGNATSSSNSGLFQGTTNPGNHTVYDYAVVLVGNYHNYNDMEASMDKPYTVTSVDLDGDNEPDYSYILRFDSRKKVHPVRVDFINIPGLGMAQKSYGGTGTYNFGIMQPKGWFESTNTSLFRETQFEYDNSERIAAPYILQGGVMEQWVNGQSAGHANKTTYFHVGGNVWFKEFHRGTHQDQNYDANHSPVSVTGGDFDQFHLTGLYRADVTIRDDNAECYITGGRFRVVAGTGMDGIGHPTNHTNGNITWIIDNADIKEFYAGSFNADKPAQGNLHTIVNGGHIDFFCGGPKFGDMNAGRTVTTTATGCTFGTFFGAGYGGNSYSRQAPRNHNNIVNFPHNDNQAGNDASWNAWLARFYTQEYNSTYGGVSTQFNYQFLPMSGNVDNVARIFVDYVKFSLATTHNVTSTLMGCTVTGNFYGGGSLGKVEGNVTSTLDGCTVKGNVFGAGFSASLPSVEVDSVGFRTEPYYYEDLGTYRTGMKGVTTTYTWEHGDAISIDIEHHKLYTPLNLSTTNLGSVSGAVTLTLKGSTTVGTFDGSGTLTSGGNVYGGGDESAVNDPDNPANASTSVFLQGNTHVGGNVYGGGNNGAVGGDSSVTIQDD